VAFNLRIWSLGFTAIAIGALATIALSLIHARGARQLRIALALTCLSAICALATQGPFALLVLRDAAGLAWPFEWRWPVIALGEAVVGLLWLSVMVLFEDVRISPLRLAPTAVLIALSFACRLTNAPGGGVFGAAAAILNLALMAHAFVCVARGLRDDLVERRRRLRRPLLLVLAFALVVVLAVQTTLVGPVAKLAYTPASAVLDVVIAAMAVAIGAWLLQPQSDLLAEPPLRRESDEAADAAVLMTLNGLMDDGEIWRREGLTVSALAAEVGIPEHRLRVLINRRLGHRNFAAFINARRIDAARRQLADAAFASTPISKIAYDLGFASLGPFNRAFKDAEGVSPSEWRREQRR
jgi:AraC-like DNA-binding protein